MEKSAGTPSSGAARPKREGAVRSFLWWRLAIVLAAVVPIGILAGTAWVTYEEAGREAERRLDELAKGAEEQAARILERNDVVMQQMLELLKDDDDAALREREAELHDVAMAILSRFRDIRSLSVWSRDGKLLVSTLFFPVPYAIQRVDWDYFRAGLAMDHISGERLFRATKPRRVAAGPGGEVELAFSSSSFHEAFRRLVEGRKGRTLSLLSAEGYVLGQWPSGAPALLAPWQEARLMQRIHAAEPRGTLRGNLFAAEHRHFAAFRKIGDHALFVAALEAPETVFDDWKRNMLALAAILLPITAALVLAAGLVLRRTRRELEARRRLSEESKQRQVAEESLRHAQRLDALGQLAGGLAHDFNNLLAIVASSAELMGKAVPGAAGRPELASIERAAHRGTRLTRRLLAFFRRQALQAEIVGVAELLDDVRELLRTTAGGGVVVKIDVEADTPAVKVDAAEMEIALINLVANARDAMSGAGHIDIRACAARDGEGEKVVISVTDNGDGMSAETLSQAFKPFFTTKPAGQGTGLGLSQVASFCEQSGGKVEVASELKVGTTVSMHLPALARPTRAALGARVILVHADANCASPLVLELKKHGCVVTSVASAQDAERLIAGERTHFDAVLADASDAASWASRLRRRPLRVPLVLVDGRGERVIAALSEAIAEDRRASRLH